VPGFALAVKEQVLAPNAGIDKSNVAPGHAILYPARPFHTARLLQEEVRFHVPARIGVVLADSRLMPTRLGTTGVAVAVAGFEPVRDERGRRDLFGNVLRVTQRALADDLASAAQLLMGEANERIPLVLVRGAPIRLSDRELSAADLAVDQEVCLYVRGLGEGRLPRVDLASAEGIPR
jgi:F420-0:gamma-glutamyl ligase